MTTTDIAPGVTSAHDLVNNLAMCFVLGGAEQSGGQPAWMSALETISQAAGREGIAGLAAEATQLHQRLTALDPESAEFSTSAQAGLQALQTTLEIHNLGAESRETASASSLALDRELVADFVTESREHLRTIEQNVLELEQEPGRAEPVHAIFRAFHTIKGIAGFLEFGSIQEISHETETLLDLVRNGKLALGSPIVDVILEAADYLGREVSRIEAGRTQESVSTGPLLAKLQAALHNSSEAQPASAAPPCEKSEEPAEEALETQAFPAGAALTSFIKVDTAKLDSLVDMVGEMVIAQSLVRHSPELSGSQNALLQRHVAQLSRITDEVQKIAMSMRMVPVRMLFQKMARLLRDVCRKAGKQAELVTYGDDTELDRSIVEDLADPLMHMVRNAIDHGIEPPQERLAAGKPAAGRIELRASHQGGHILIEMADDGRGMNRDAILRKALAKGLVTEAAALTDSDVYNLIFQPGFSTAEKVTDISGRGVGMDVVKRQVQKLRGRTEIHTEAGKGSTFRLTVPLTLAIIDGLVVGVGTERYIVPVFAVKRMLRPTPGMLSTIENRHEVALIGERVLPVVRLYRRFGVQPRSEDPLESLLILTESHGTEYCLMVDALLGKQEVVIKSLGDSLRKISGVAGGAILGDGRVGLILEMNALLQSARAA